MRRAQNIVGLIMGTLIILVITNLSTGTLNPFQVFEGDNLLLKILVGFFMFTVALNLLTLLFGRSVYRDKVCAADGKGLMEFASVYGPPMRCLYCKRYFHKRCFQEKGGTMRGGCRREPCPSAFSAT